MFEREKMPHGAPPTPTGTNRFGNSPNRKRRVNFSSTDQPKAVEDGMTTSKAFWKLFRKTMGFEPAAKGGKTLTDDGGYAKHQAMLTMFRRKYGIRLNEEEGEKLAGDREDPSRESSDARMMMAAFDKKLSEMDDEYEFVPEADDTFDWSDEARVLANLISSDLRLEDRRRPELTTRDFALSYFKSLRMKDMNIVHIDEGLKDFTSLTELSLSGNPLGMLRRLPETLVILNVYNCNIREIGDMVLPNLVHLGIGYNEINDEVLAKFPEHFPNILSLDIGYNHLTNFRKTTDSLGGVPKLMQLMLFGNPCCLIRGYTSLALQALQKLARFDNVPVGADDREHYDEVLRRLVEEEKAAQPSSEVEEVVAAVGGEDGGEEENKDAEKVEEVAQAEEPQDPLTVLQISVSTVMNAPTPTLPKPPPKDEVSDESSMQSSEGDSKGKKKGGKKTPSPPSRPASPEEMTVEDWKTLAQEQDLRYFVRVIPPSKAGEHIAYTTRAIEWDPEIVFGDTERLEVPRTAELTECIQFDGLHLELWQSYPGIKTPVGADTKDEGKNGGSPEPSGETEDEAGLGETEVPRRDVLVAQADVGLSALLNIKSNGVGEVDLMVQWKALLTSNGFKLGEDTTVSVKVQLNAVPIVPPTE